ncbi:MAG: hypothetical protein UR31_C0001G0017 [Parcubacteria group bacterium GW2011_GWA2_33_14]|uniref:Uncharacterized protein n=1 Tax=Candidatus Staskawiczbacteria bacterium RIFCSPHIGHO2_02_FULL_33_16 TaxID=1802204 RepID=A0A1G2HU65_9BACT|nr:MAG: hypothetical protein UR31_C0001G0017 [Parcubacteria group bacterium GW2011_GWA2_33_14]OGZ66062.1 MAG: hypothetical protein A3D34_02680 [Candidatus Staskawiczbacteria bacterium RIFCSPHIGHO2_02_FULL_33_16]OGZ70813.1 MAG: hypothetical protein A2980_02170 [Candidatus Staskawiczbacteria bacterium RIFCSPLOWO2_01_FULL_33_13]
MEKGEISFNPEDKRNPSWSELSIISINLLRFLDSIIKESKFDNETHKDFLKINRQFRAIGFPMRTKLITELSINPSEPEDRVQRLVAINSILEFVDFVDNELSNNGSSYFDLEDLDDYLSMDKMDFLKLWYKRLEEQTDIIKNCAKQEAESN